MLSDFLDRWSPWRLRRELATAVAANDLNGAHERKLISEVDELRSLLRQCEIVLGEVRDERDAFRTDLAALRIRLNDALTAREYVAAAQEHMASAEVALAPPAKPTVPHCPQCIEGSCNYSECDRGKTITLIPHLPCPKCGEFDGVTKQTLGRHRLYCAPCNWLFDPTPERQEARDDARE